MPQRTGSESVLLCTGECEHKTNIVEHNSFPGNFGYNLQNTFWKYSEVIYIIIILKFMWIFKAVVKSCTRANACTQRNIRCQRWRDKQWWKSTLPALLCQVLITGSKF